MTVDGTRLQRRLEDLRRERASIIRTYATGEADSEIRRAIAAVVAAGEGYSTPQPVWHRSE
jgi:hypothetical protein